MNDPRKTRQWRTIRAELLADNPPCYWCGQPATEADHLVPVDTGAADPYDRSLLVPSCKPCNARRGQKHLTEKNRARQKARQQVTERFVDGKPLTPTPMELSICHELAGTGGDRFELAGTDLVGVDVPRLATPEFQGDGKGLEIAAFADRVLGVKLFPWQVLVLDRWFRTDSGGRWVAPMGVVSVGRQAGKTTLLECAIGWLFCEYAQQFKAKHGRELRILSTANELDLAVESFNELADVLEGIGAKVIRAYGRNGAEWDYAYWRVKAARKSKHGGTWDIVIGDELWQLSPDFIYGALLPSQAAVPDPLALFASTAGDESSTVFKSVREQALQAIETNEPGTLTYLEWSVPPSVGLDEQYWGWANPSLGRTIQPSTLRANLERMGPTKFARAHLNQWVAAADSWLTPGEWEQLETADPMPSGGFLAIESSVDESRFVAVRAVTINGIAQLQTEIVTNSETKLWERVLEIMADPTVVLAVTPTLEIHVPASLNGRYKLWGYGELLKFTALVRGMIREKKVAHRGEIGLSEHMNRAVMVKTVQGSVLSSAKSPGPIELARVAVAAIAFSSKPQIVGKPFAVGGRR